MSRAGKAISLIALLLILLCALSPQAAFGLKGQGCVCADSLTGSPCGTEGFVCHCCKEDAMSHLSGVPLLKKCNALSESFNIATPPAIAGFVNIASTHTPDQPLIISPEGSGQEGYSFTPLKPPRTLPV